MMAPGNSAPAPTGAAAAKAAPQDELPPIPQLTKDLDELFLQAWKDANVTPAADAAPGELLRRLTLDLAGRLPTYEESQAFFACDDREKVRRAVERLLASRECAEHFADTLMVALLGRESQLDALDRRYFTDWLATEIQKDTPFDQIASEILGAKTDHATKEPAGFYVLLGGAPQDLAGKTARFFLGNRIQCAQCHDHPYEPWKRTDFWQLAAYFQRVKREPVYEQISEKERKGGKIARIIDWKLDELPNGDTYIPLQPHEEGRPALALPRFLGGTYDLTLQAQNEKRLPRLAEAVTKQKRPLFARAMANRFFAELFGRGIVHPIDDFSDQHAPTLPKVLDRITRGFDEGGLKLRSYLRALALTRAYARSSVREPAASDQVAEVQVSTNAPPVKKDARDPSTWKKAVAEDPALEVFARMRHKPLTPEQVLRAFVTASRAREVAELAGEQAAKNWKQQEQGFHQQFIQLLSHNDDDDPHSVQESIPQVLVLMNGPAVSFFCQARKGSTAELAAQDKDVDSRLDRLYLAAFSRRPSDLERVQAHTFFASKKPEQTTKATEDYFWTMLNSSEFFYNH